MAKKLIQEEFEKLKGLRVALIDKDGREILSPVPKEFTTELQQEPHLIE